MKAALLVTLSVTFFTFIVTQWFFYGILVVCYVMRCFNYLNIVCSISFFFFAITTSFRDPGRLTSLTIQQNTSKKDKIYIFSKFTQFHCKYCQSCKFHLPTYSTHCSHCNQCVLMFDHHCTYLSCDIGARNLLIFLLMLFSGFLFFSLHFLIQIYILVIGMKQNNILIMIVCPYFCYYTFFAVGLTYNMISYHHFLLKEKLTTKLYMKTNYNLLNLSKENLIRADKFLEESQIDIIEKLRAKLWFNYLSKGYQRVLIGFLLPNLFKLDIKEAEKLAWSFSIYLIDLQCNLPEHIIKFM